MKFKKNIKIETNNINKNSPVFIIAEAGVNHDGDFDKAKKLIDIASSAGADAVKFQTWITEELISKDAEKATYQKEQTGTTESQFEMLKKLELSFEEFRKLKKYCDKKNILFISTPDEEKSAEFLNSINVPVFKIGSGELTNLLFIKQIASYKKPIIISTGMSTIDQISEALDEIHSTGCNEVIVLHCTTDYPTPPSDVNLNAMKTIEEKFDVLVGYSDHTKGTSASLLATHLGAKIIEKHFTYDKTAKGPDHQASLSEQELKKLIKIIREYESSNKKSKIIDQIIQKQTLLGSPVKKPTEREVHNKKAILKSICARKDLKKGDIIQEEDIIMLRQSNEGIPSNKYKEVIGKSLIQDIKKNNLIQIKNLKNIKQLEKPKNE